MEIDGVQMQMAAPGPRPGRASGEDSAGPRLRIAVLGAGAMGTLFGCRLAEAGEDVTLVCRRPEAAEQIRRQGVLLTDGTGSRRVEVRAVLAQDLRGEPDAVFVFTKSMQTEAALASIRERIGSQTYLVSLQNGLRGQEQLGGFAGPAHIVLGVTNYAGDLRGDGCVTQNGGGYVKMARADGGADPFVEKLCRALVRAGFAAAVVPDIDVAIWEKAVFNTAINTVTALCRATCGEVGASPEGRNLVYQLGNEAVSVAHALGVQVSARAVRQALEATFIVHKDHYTSMAQDILAHRKTEIDSLGGAILQKADGLGLPVPAIRATWQLIKTVESLG